MHLFHLGGLTKNNDIAKKKNIQKTIMSTEWLLTSSEVQGVDEINSLGTRDGWDNLEQMIINIKIYNIIFDNVSKKETVGYFFIISYTDLGSIHGNRLIVFPYIVFWIVYMLTHRSLC